MGKIRQCLASINSWDSLVVTHPTTSQSAGGLSTGDRTGTSIFRLLWSIAEEQGVVLGYIGLVSLFLGRCRYWLPEDRIGWDLGTPRVAWDGVGEDGWKRKMA